MAGAAANPAAVLQWPMRDVVRAYSREAPDHSAIFFALFVAVSVTADLALWPPLSCGCRGAALFTATAALHQDSSGSLTCSWALFVLISASKSTVISSLKVTRVLPYRDPAYFVIKLSLWIMAAIILAQAFLDIARPVRRGERLMEWSGVALLLLVAVGVIGTGLPAEAAMIRTTAAGRPVPITPTATSRSNATPLHSIKRCPDVRDAQCQGTPGRE